MYAPRKTVPPGGGGATPAHDLHHVPRPSYLFIAHTEEDGEPFLADRDLRMGIAVSARELRDALTPAFRYKGL